MTVPYLAQLRSQALPAARKTGIVDCGVQLWITMWISSGHNDVPRLGLHQAATQKTPFATAGL